ncbi:hypothetical protein ACEN32_02655 [Marinilactibacillus psychrotolerans]|uniref:hypothetical protein n=1 Tax=Marinilactibacillus psychrotolerans TaxID=191770 RepID=UPI003886C57D
MDKAKGISELEPMDLYKEYEKIIVRNSVLLNDLLNEKLTKQINSKSTLIQNDLIYLAHASALYTNLAINIPDVNAIIKSSMS